MHLSLKDRYIFKSTINIWLLYRNLKNVNIWFDWNIFFLYSSDSYVVIKFVSLYLIYMLMLNIEMRWIVLQYLCFRTIFSAGMRAHQRLTMANGNRVNLFARDGKNFIKKLSFYCNRYDIIEVFSHQNLPSLNAERGM